MAIRGLDPCYLAHSSSFGPLGEAPQRCPLLLALCPALSFHPVQHSEECLFFCPSEALEMFVMKIWAFLYYSGNQTPSKERELVEIERIYVSPGTVRVDETEGPVSWS